MAGFAVGNGMELITMSEERETKCDKATSSQQGCDNARSSDSGQQRCHKRRANFLNEVSRMYWVIFSGSWFWYLKNRLFYNMYLNRVPLVVQRGWEAFDARISDCQKKLIFMRSVGHQDCMWRDLWAGGPFIYLNFIINVLDGWRGRLRRTSGNELVCRYDRHFRQSPRCRYSSCKHRNGSKVYR